ncbi:uncharacterized protein I303_103261 [Kwoniella dejecticola CBS 10117]|uniref:Major facilitator superfamily (MFS) profile domain-containing protein n=1 Tax=Kwoniella dejecticola CBS 10117 TaxID=1296121 RepID=A0AAJ8KN90_9TREE
MSVKAGWKQTTPFLVFCVIAYAWGDLMFGIDTGSFGSLQVLPAWLKDFGHLDPATGKYSNPTSRTSIMNSVVFAGKLVGTMLFEPIAERLGYKYTMYITALIQFVALIIELTAKNWVVFTVGRIIAYLSVGIVENCVPSYISEISPAGVRGFMSGTMTVLVTVGNLWGAGMSRIFATETRRIGWIIPVAIQFLPALGILVLVPFTPESPRWLITGLLFWFYQSTGVQFVNIYGPTFYTQMGWGKMAFTYSVIAQACGIVATIVGIVVIDHFGRRPPIILGSFVCIIFNALIAGLGSKKNPSVTEGHAVIASTVMVLVGSKMFQCVSFLMASEIGGKSMRKKFMGYGTSVDVLSAFVFTFCLPYLLKKPGANLGPKVGWLIAGDSLFAFIFSVFYVPEIAGRSLEEMDELFEMRLWAWQFKNAETSGVGRRIAQLEAGHTTGDKMEMDEYIEDSKKLEKQRVEVGQRQS